MSNSDGTSSSRSVTEYYNGKAIICNFHYPIYRWDCLLPPGGYSLPFNFRLPPQLPGSFFYEKRCIKAIINYKFHAKLISIEREQIKASIPVHIRQGVYDYNANLSLNKDARLVTWCCSNQGYCKINVVHQQDTYNPSQTAVVLAEVDNSNSKLSVNSITARLFFSLRLKCSGPSTYFFKETLITESIPIRIAPGAALLNSSAVQIQLNLPSCMQTLSNMYSTKGALIDCTYTIEVRADMDGSCMCCGEQPSIQALMKIVPNIIIALSAPVAPPDWNPSVLDQVNIYYDPQYEVAPIN